MELKTMIHDYLDYSYATKAPKTASMDRDALRVFMKVVGDLELGDITSAHFEKFRLARLQEISPTSVNVALRHLKAAFNWAVERGLLKHSPAAKVKLNRVPKNLHPRFLSAEEIDRLRQEIEEDTELLQFVNFALWTGMRRDEIVTLEWSEVDLERRVITVRNKAGFRTKSRKSRTVPISPSLHEMLVAMKAASRKSGHRVFEINYWSVGKRFLRAVRAAKLEGKVSLHTLRHTFASHLVMQGVDLASIQEILGHFDVTVTMIYAHLSPGHLARTVEKLPY
jgi:integrase